MDLSPHRRHRSSSQGSFLPLPSGGGSGGSGPSAPSVVTPMCLQVVLYRDRHLVVYNPETQRLGARELTSSEEFAVRQLWTARCPMCSQSVDPRRLTFEAQSYFILLQNLLSANAPPTRTSGGEWSPPSEENVNNPFVLRRPYRHVDCRESQSSTRRVSQRSIAALDMDADLDKGPPPPQTTAEFLLSLSLSQEELKVPVSTRPNSSSCAAPDSVDEPDDNAFPTTRNIPSGLLVTGYYNKFFQEIRKLGSGSFGQVFLCHHVLDDIVLGEYAVKKIPVGDDKTWLHSMIREVKIRERLHHPSVVDYKHSWLEMHRANSLCPYVPWLFVLMEFCNGGDLEGLIWDSSGLLLQTLPERTIWKLFLDIVMGLQHLHHSGILHRDLKLSNILLQRGHDEVTGAPTCQALLADFGTAELMSECVADSATSQLPRAQSCLRRGFTGTVEFTAPELLVTDAEGRYTDDYDVKSDMWSLGVILYALAFGTLPFSDVDPEVCRMKILQSLNTSLVLPGTPERSSELRFLIEALVSKNPNMRPSTDDLLSHPQMRRIFSEIDEGKSSSCVHISGFKNNTTEDRPRRQSSTIRPLQNSGFTQRPPPASDGTGLSLLEALGSPSSARSAAESQALIPLTFATFLPSPLPRQRRT